MRHVVKTLEGMDRLRAARLEREEHNRYEVQRAIMAGMNPPEVGTSGVYEPPGQSPVTFRVVSVEGMICKCRYVWQSERDDPSCFIWGFLKEAEHNKFHVWPGHSDWGV